MANEQNLRPVTSKKEARERGRKGGIASGEARRKRKTLKEELILMLEDEEVQKSVTTALINQAKKGNVKAFGMLRDTIGEAPVEKIMIADVEPSVVAEVEKMVNGE